MHNQNNSSNINNNFTPELMTILNNLHQQNLHFNESNPQIAQMTPQNFLNTVVNTGQNSNLPVANHQMNVEPNTVTTNQINTHAQSNFVNQIDQANSQPQNIDPC